MRRTRRNARVAVWGDRIDRGVRTNVEELTRRLLEILKIENAAIDVFVLPHKEMIVIKRKFYPTKRRGADVLAFPEIANFPHPERPERSLGEVYLNLRFVRNPRRTATLLIHGILHCVGYDHERKRDMLPMRKREKELREGIAPYLQFLCHHRSSSV